MPLDLLSKRQFKCIQPCRVFFFPYWEMNLFFKNCTRRKVRGRKGRCRVIRKRKFTSSFALLPCDISLWLREGGEFFFFFFLLQAWQHTVLLSLLLLPVLSSSGLEQHLQARLSFYLFYVALGHLVCVVQSKIIRDILLRVGTTWQRTWKQGKVE